MLMFAKPKSKTVVRLCSNVQIVFDRVFKKFEVIHKCEPFAVLIEHILKLFWLGLITGRKCEETWTLRGRCGAY